MSDQPPLITHLFTADPSAHVFNGKLYIYPSHDVATDIQDNDYGDRMYKYISIYSSFSTLEIAGVGCEFHTYHSPNY